MRRGGILTVVGAVNARSAPTLQDDRFDPTDSVTVCPFTSAT